MEFWEGEEEGVAIVHVCRTGKKGQMYTLHMSMCFGRGRVYQYVQNLSKNKKDALAGAELFKKGLMYGEMNATIEFEESPRPVYTHFETYCAIKMKMNQDRTRWYEVANDEFMALWKDQQQKLRGEGYWIYKKENGENLVLKKKRVGA